MDIQLSKSGCAGPEISAEKWGTKVGPKNNGLYNSDQWTGLMKTHMIKAPLVKIIYCYNFITCQLQQIAFTNFTRPCNFPTLKLLVSIQMIMTMTKTMM